MHPLYCVLHLPYVSELLHGVLWSRIGIYILYTNAPTRCRTSQYHRTFIFSLFVSLHNNLVDPVLYGVVLAGFYEHGRCSFGGESCSLLFCLLLFSLSLLSSTVWYCGTVVFELVGWLTLSSSLTLLTCFNNNNNFSWNYVEFSSYL